MDSPADTKQTDARDVGSGLSTQEIELVARADERLAHAYEQIARADEQLARLNEQVFKLDRDAARRSSGAKRAVKPLHRPSRGRPALRGLIGLLLAAGICTAAFAWQSYGETVRPMIFRWAPQLASSLPSETPKLAAQQSPPAVQVARGGCCTFAIITSGSDRAAGGGSRPDPTRGDTVAPNDGA